MNVYMPGQDFSTAAGDRRTNGWVGGRDVRLGGLENSGRWVGRDRVILSSSH